VEINQDSKLQSQQSTAFRSPKGNRESLERAKPAWVLRLNGTQERICFAALYFVHPSKAVALYCRELENNQDSKLQAQTN
jgi:hypothetical protein